MKRFICCLLIVCLCLAPGMSIYATESVNQEESSMETQASDESQPASEGVDLGLQSEAAVLMEASTGQIIYEKNADERLSPASITKIMTLLLIFEALDEGKIALSDEATTSAYAKSMGGSQVYLEEGEKQTIETLIKCIVIASGNDASVTMAEHLAGSEVEFVNMMNKRAAELGMTNTNFEDCCGLSESANHYTSARDVAIMSRELTLNHPEVHSYASIWMEDIVHVTNKGSSDFTLSNTNKLLRQYDGCTGLKTGSTSIAKYCLSATANRQEVNLISVILAAPESAVRFNEAATMLNYGFANVQVYKDEAPGALEMVRVNKGVADWVSTEYENIFSYLSTTGENFDNIEKEWVYEEDIMAPIVKGQQVGTLVYRLDGKEIGTVAIVASDPVDMATYFDCVKKMWKRFMKID